MRPVVKLYVIRVILSIIAAALSTALAIALNNDTSYVVLINAITVSLLVYLVSYYILRPIFKNVITPSSKIMTTGIGIYFFSWLFFLVLFYTLFKTIPI